MRASAGTPGVGLDVVVVGAGVSGLAAASMLGRCHRRVAVLGGTDRANSTAAEVHNLPYAEGMAPEEMYAAMEGELSRYGVARIDDVVQTIEVDADAGRIEVTCAESRLSCGRLVLANGVDYEVPDWVPSGFWGTSVFSCPFCHAYQHDGEDFVVVGAGSAATASALLCAVHARTLTVLVSDPEAAMSDAAGRVRAGGGDVVVGSVVQATAGRAGRLKLLTSSGPRLTAGAVLLAGNLFMRTTLTAQLGLEVDMFGIPQTSEDGRSSQPRIWVAGTAARPEYMLAEAIGSGIRVGVSIHEDICMAGP